MRLNIDQKEKNEIEGLLGDEGYSDYEFQDGDLVLVVGGITSEHEGEQLEENIKSLIS
jgi:hypothetical protein